MEEVKNFLGGHNIRCVSVALSPIAEDFKLAQHDPQIHHIFLSSNGLTRIPHEFIHGLSDLRSFRILYNKLSDIPEELFQGLNQIEHIQFYENQSLTSIPRRLFRSLVNLKQLYSLL
eukprot:TRINITY_DN5847_c0_g1_i9.p1 TRINITY_DN5847_c0_g1~~TRINITY_DN5847_c0_g1_i9.p1  ORF type:complete len:117 (+),score=24.00 TRINITY_DN5847_c0_g1_i9:1-351(+)